ncbi:9872_t:CDS:2 [Diversispora eburnea]|uniref:9872_t:CDS:1 n=1 Tax=Diversispora eburnea TaxID=1213867 RepID=A0A9N8V038_9GLOM|nr:9872_t:CDS:2 [Diversispora eburnea]
MEALGLSECPDKECSLELSLNRKVPMTYKTGKQISSLKVESDLIDLEHEILPVEADLTSKSLKYYL